MKKILLPIAVALLLPMTAGAVNCDVSGDGTVDVTDLNLVINEILAGTANYDLNGNGVVDVTEMNLVLNAIINPESPDVDPTDEEFTVEGVTFKCIYVEGGTFTMGGRNIKQETSSYLSGSNTPAHEVTLSSFKIMETEVIQKLYYAFMSDTSDCKPGDYYYDTFFRYRYDDYPVYYCSWDNAMLFAQKLSEATGRQFRLPTEAEWEFAAKGGVKSQGYLYSGSDNLSDVGQAHFQSSEHPYGYEQSLCVPKTKRPNELGIYDMSGNVNEWCLDEEARQYTADPQVNPLKAGGNPAYDGSNWYDYRMTRGGSKDTFWYYFVHCTNEGRGGLHRSGQPDCGFRLVLVD